MISIFRNTKSKVTSITRADSYIMTSIIVLLIFYFSNYNHIYENFLFIFLYHPKLHNSHSLSTYIFHSYVSKSTLSSVGRQYFLRNKKLLSFSTLMWVLFCCQQWFLCKMQPLKKSLITFGFTRIPYQVSRIRPKTILFVFLKVTDFI